MMFPDNQRAEGDQALAGVEGGETVRRAKPGSLLTFGKKKRRIGDRLRAEPLEMAVDRLDRGPDVLGPAEVELPVAERAARPGRPLTGEGVVSLQCDAASTAR